MALELIRKNIDLLDSKILKLLNDRMELCLMAKKFKSQLEDIARMLSGLIRGLDKRKN